MTVERFLAGAMLACMAVAAQAQDDIQDLANRWVQAYNVHDRAALGAVYTDNARVTTHGQATIVGRQAIESFWAEDFKDRDPLTLLDVTHSVNGLDMKLVHGDYEVISRTDGRRLGAGRFAHIWTRQKNGDWRLDRDLWNDSFEPYSSTESMGGTVQQLADRWTAAYNKHDRAALQAVYTSDATLMMHGLPTIAGQQAIGAFWAEDFLEKSPITLLTVTHAVQGVDMVLVHGNYEVVNRANGTQLTNGRFAHVWFSDGKGGWALDRDLWFERGRE